MSTTIIDNTLTITCPERTVPTCNPTDPTAILARAESIVDDVEVPEGVTLSVSLQTDADGELSHIVVQLSVEEDTNLPHAAWEAIEEAIDLSPLGLAFREGGGLGKWSQDWTIYTSSYQTWTPVEGGAE